jgi:hypothetical protein
MTTSRFHVGDEVRFPSGWVTLKVTKSLVNRKGLHVVWLYDKSDKSTSGPYLTDTLQLITRDDGGE